MAMILNDLFDSSDDEENNIFPFQPIVRNDDDDFYELRMLHPIFGLVQRIEHVKINNYIEHIVHNYNNIDFLMHFRLSRRAAYQLIDQFTVSEIFTSIQERVQNNKISAEKHILCYLWFVGHQTGSYRDVADRFGITISALHTVITRVTDFILALAHNIIKYPTDLEKEQTSNFYLQQKGFPNIIGAIDGSHIRIDKPVEDPDSYINRKQYFSIHVQGTVNHDMKFIDVFIGYPGSVHDARVLKNSTLYNDLHNLCGDNYYLLGDSAYPCLKQLIVPYKDNGHLTRAQRSFNQKLSSCRVVIENAFGCLKQRFRQLYHFKLRDIPRMVRVIHACCVLHNIANVQDLHYFEPQLNEEHPDIQLENRPIVIIDNAREYEDDVRGTHVRDEICNLLSR